MMTVAAKIYQAKTRWNMSYTQIAFLLEMDKTIVSQIYHQECLRLKKMNTITMDSQISECVNVCERTKNILKRHNIRTIEQLIRLKKPENVAWRAVGKATEAEILEAAARARKELGIR